MNYGTSLDDETSKRLGFIVPSSNVRIEPGACALLGAQPSVTAHFSRIGVRTVSLDEESNAQFELTRLLAAAEQLNDAGVGAITWAGTSGSWRGLKLDRELVSVIGTAFGVPAATSTLSVLEACSRLGVHDVALLTPYTDPIVSAIVANLRGEGLNVLREDHLGISDSHACSEVPDGKISSAIQQLAGVDVDAIVVLCTNFGLGGDAGDLEREIGIPIIDSVSATIWHACSIARVWRAQNGRGRLLATDETGMSRDAAQTSSAQ